MLGSNPCPDGRCLHGGTCSPADNSDGFVCDCTGTLYEGKTCNKGLVVVDPIGSVKRFERKIITVRAKPDNATTYQIEDCFGVSIPIQGSYFLNACRLDFDNATTSKSLTLTAFAPGSFSFKFVGVDAPPVPFVITSGSSPYFDNFDDVQSSCCGNTLPVCHDPVELMSSCSWNKTSQPHVTRGIVFIEYDNMKVPISLAGLQITTSGTITTTLPSRDNTAMCSSCGLTPIDQLSIFTGNCYEHISTPGDLSEFVKNQSLTVSFLSSIRSSLFPSWFSLNKAEDMNALNKLSNTDFLAKIVSSNELLKEGGCESLVIENSDGQFVLLQHNGPLNLQLESEIPSILHSPSLSNYYCIAVHVCSGQSSPVYIGLPPSAQTGINRISFISNYIQRGWKFNFQSTTLTKVPQTFFITNKLWNGVTYSEHISRVRIQYDTLVKMKAEGQYSYGMANVKLSFNGSVRYNYITERSSEVITNTHYMQLICSHILTGKYSIARRKLFDCNYVQNIWINGKTGIKGKNN